MEFLLELLLEIIMEGSIELGSAKSVPMPIRILAAVIVFSVFFGMGGVLVYMGCDAAQAGDPGAAVALILVGAALLLGGIFVIVKMFRKNANSGKT